MSPLPTRTMVIFILAGSLATSPSSAVKRRAFATSVVGTGNLASWAAAGGQTGLAAGDAICRARAAAAGLPNSNAYRAWLSTSVTDAYCHVQGLTGKRFPACTGGPPQAAGPWYLYNGTSYFAGSLAELTGTAGTIHRPVLTDEFGVVATSNDQMYWTGTLVNGTIATGDACGDWSSASAGDLGLRGATLGSAVVWTSRQWSACNATHRLLCLEPGASEVQPRLGWVPAALVFVTSARGTGDLSSWPEAGAASGMAAGDQICRTLAAEAHLPAPQSFVAWLSDATVDARDRITTNGPFRRVDAFVVADTKADLIDGSTDNSIHLFEDGRYLTGTESVFTGTDGDGVLKTPNCGHWTIGSSGTNGAIGIAGHARYIAWTENAFSGCSQTLRLYCFSNVVTLFWDGFEITGDTSRWSSTVP